MKFLLQNLVDHGNEFFRVQGLQGIQMPIHFFRHLVIVFLFLTHFKSLSCRNAGKSLTVRFGIFNQYFITVCVYEQRVCPARVQISYRKTGPKLLSGNDVEYKNDCPSASRPDFIGLFRQGVEISYIDEGRVIRPNPGPTY